MRDDLLERLEHVHDLMEGKFKMSPEKKREILNQRAVELAQEPDKEERDSKSLEVVEFLLAHERYAIEIDYIREIYPLKEFTSLPCTPDFVLGIVSVRGQIMSVIDLKKLFGLPDKKNAEMDRIIILRSNGKEFGILTDNILGVRSISLSDIQTSLPTFTGIHDKYLMGITVDRIAVLNGEKMLSDSDLVVHEEME